MTRADAFYAVVMGLAILVLLAQTYRAVVTW